MDARDRVREELLGWELDDDGIHKSVEVGDYAEAMGLTVRIALEAQRRNHHPDLLVTWGSVVITLVTHDADSSVTDADVDLAAWIDGILA